jgi:MoaA/NifB/PqqE/SkfB family radical SAM enzyme
VTEEELAILEDYLRTRSQETHQGKAFGVVFELTKKCNLRCLHCAPNAEFVKNPGKVTYELTLAETKLILDKLKAYVVKEGIEDLYLIFGGGEPTLHPDIESIVHYSATLFGASAVGINTNGTTGVPKMMRMDDDLGFVEVSIDGLSEYHNMWRNPGNVAKIDAFEVTMSFVRELARIRSLAAKLEVSSVLTKDNARDLFDLMVMLEDAGVKNYSVHRSMPVGRMALRLDSIPSQAEFLRFIINVARFRGEHPDFKVHIHHSLESIFSALLLGEDIHRSKDYMGSSRHSIGVDWKGNVHFDPWAVEAPFDTMAAGNLLQRSARLDDLLHGHDNFVRQLDLAVRNEERCLGCPLKCSGGMRFNALVHYLLQKRIYWKIPPEELRRGIVAVDPACPMYDVIHSGLS